MATNIEEIEECAEFRLVVEAEKALHEGLHALTFHLEQIRAIAPGRDFLGSAATHEAAVAAAPENIRAAAHGLRAADPGTLRRLAELYEREIVEHAPELGAQDEWAARQWNTFSPMESGRPGAVRRLRKIADYVDA